MIQNYSSFPNITLESASLEFMNHLISALQTIESRNTGRDLLKEINELCGPSTGKHIKIVAIASDYSETANTCASVGNATDALKKWIFKGPGTSVEVTWNPYSSLALNAQGIPTGMSYQDDSTSFIGLAHELVHAYRILRGTYLGGSNIKEETRATGIGDSASKKFSENSIRAEHSLPRRNAYSR